MATSSHAYMHNTCLSWQGLQTEAMQGYVTLKSWDVPACGQGYLLGIIWDLLSDSHDPPLSITSWSNR